VGELLDVGAVGRFVVKNVIHGQAVTTVEVAPEEVGRKRTGRAK
jgi:hypothetical protein